jgi:hypothetical protein
MAVNANIFMFLFGCLALYSDFTAVKLLKYVKSGKNGKKW